jgi:hypothetical protein
VSIPRLVYSVNESKDGLKHLCVIKGNIVRKDEANICFRIKGSPFPLDDGSVQMFPVITWLGRSEATADDMVGETKQGSPAREFLLRGGRLEDWRLVSEVCQEADELWAIPTKTLRNTASLLVGEGLISNARDGNLHYWKLGKDQKFTG